MFQGFYDERRVIVRDRGHLGILSVVSMGLYTRGVYVS